MNIEGLDYNTQRERIKLNEYGREIQQMVDYCVTIPDREERQACAEAIYKVATDKVYAHQLVENGKKQLLKYDNYEQRAEKLVRILEEITA